MKSYLLFLLIAISVFLLVILLYSRFIGTRGLYIKEYAIRHENLPSNFHGLKIAHLSDLHFGEFINEDKTNKIVNKVNQLKPDIVVFTGDLIENDLTEDEQVFLGQALSKINARLGKYAIRGNHDLDYDYWDDIITKGGFKNLEEKTELVYKETKQPIVIHGMSSNLKDETPPNNKLTDFYNHLEANPALDNTYHILIMHEPDYIDKINVTDFNLVLAGHSHRGQIRLPIFGPLLLPNGATKYYDEFYQLENTKLYISSGIGNSQLNLRLFNRPSFNFYRIIN